MNLEKKHKKIIKDNYGILISFDIPSGILDNLKKWYFFLQEGWDVESGWKYADGMSVIQQIKLYRFIKLHIIESSLSNEIALKYNLKNKQQFEIRIVENTPNKISFDFFINQKQLSKQIGINRFDMAYCNFDLDSFEVDSTKFPNYDRKKIIKKTVSCFLGNHKPMNQFGTNRIVVYRCHCGCDYCGVISYTLHIEDDVVIWKNINYEDDNDFESEEALNENEIHAIKELRFDTREYQEAFKKHVNTYCI